MANEERDGYDPSSVEEKWQRLWEERGTNTFTREELENAENPFYNLMMFPYPSAEGLHVGNIYAFTGADVHGRYQRLTGKTVFEPMGFDAFGIHSENFALKIGTHPMDLIPSNVRNFTRQLKRIGGMFDWNHSVDTTDPSYYKWTQWVFLQFFKAGLAERKEAPVNWCPSCMTVLANEQVVGGACERCSTPVEQRRIAQWFFEITKYAQRLLDNLEHIDWSPTTLKAQSNWIGRSTGAQLHFPIVNGKGEETGASIEVYTTRPDTVFGATYMVLSPEHPLVDRVTDDGLRAPVYAYIDKASKKDLVARQKADKSKTGVPTGGYCRNPATGELIPIWVADYVLMNYGTGAIMAVPGHDTRDFEFATQFDLPIVRVVAGPDASSDTPLEEAYVGAGKLVNSGDFDGTDTTESVDIVTRWAAEAGWGEARVNFRLHDWCISRQRYWGPPIPIIHCEACGPVAVPEADLPVVLPRVEDFKPDDSGVSPLARVEEWYRTTCPECGAAARRETDVSDTFLDSGWYFLRYPSADFDDRPFDPAITKKWLPLNTYIGGNEHAVLHLMYSRFITMVLKDLGHIDFEEPYEVFRAHGLIIADGAKMSKSKGNVIVPDPIIDEFGADTFRTYLMFLGPFEEGGDYRPQGIQGPYGFLHRLWDTVVSAVAGPPDVDVERKVHQTIRQVSEQLPALQFNTAVAALMECLNAIRAGGRSALRAEVEPMVVMIAPFAPHVAEELWERLGHEGSIFDGANWPDFDEAKTIETSIVIAVQVNGKLRASINAPVDVSEADVVVAARAEENVARHLEGVMERRVIYVPGRLVNFVVG
ncbi:MAG: leucine--tRNA ligase [Gemmatimonadetes bacterium]|nr:leucine--tRNA ligase [Gemmatimonadota bacterium]MDA1102464.1 leucine--tRNA ligase [Gemmatimonadota bacterium]